MNQGKTVFAQLLQFVPFSHFEHLVDDYQASKGVTAFSAWSHFICLAYAQLTRRAGLRDLVTCMNAQRTNLYHIGLRNTVSRSTLADAAERRESIGQHLVVAALAFYRDEDLGLGLKGPVFAMDSTTIDLCLSLFLWAHFRQTKAAVKAHVILDLRDAIPVFISITTGKVHDVRLLNAISLPAGSILTPTQKSKLGYPKRLCRVSFRGPQTSKHLVFITNLHDAPTLTIAASHKTTGRSNPSSSGSSRT